MRNKYWTMALMIVGLLRGVACAQVQWGVELGPELTLQRKEIEWFGSYKLVPDSNRARLGARASVYVGSELTRVLQWRAGLGISRNRATSTSVFQYEAPYQRHNEWRDVQATVQIGLMVGNVARRRFPVFSIDKYWGMSFQNRLDIRSLVSIYPERQYQSRQEYIPLIPCGGWVLGGGVGWHAGPAVMRAELYYHYGFEWFTASRHAMGLRWSCFLPGSRSRAMPAQ